MDLKVSLVKLIDSLLTNTKWRKLSKNKVIPYFDYADLVYIRVIIEKAGFSSLPPLLFMKFLHEKFTLSAFQWYFSYLQLG